jgi:GNAT superfamily N-acetyltransferase
MGSCTSSRPWAGSSVSSADARTGSVRIGTHGSHVTVVQPVSSRGDLKRFIEYPFALYRHDPHWVAPLLIDEWKRFDAAKNPFLAHARIQPFLALRGGAVVGRVAGIDDDHHNATHGDDLAFFGFFEAADEGAAVALLTAVETWARSVGRTGVRGPLNPSMNDGGGLQLDGYDIDPFIMMPYNPPHYPAWVEGAGYQKVKDLYAWLIDDVGLGERLTRLVDRAERRVKPVIRPMEMRHFDRELGILKRVHAEAWERNWGNVKYTDAEFDHLAADLKLIIDPDLALVAEVGDEVAGVAIGLPDANQVFKRIRGRLLPFGIVTLLRRRRYIDQIRLPILGLVPKFRRSGIELVLMREVYRRGALKGYRRCEASWILEDNHAMNNGIRAAGGYLAKTYRLYQKPL